MVPGMEQEFDVLTLELIFHLRVFGIPRPGLPSFVRYAVLVKLLPFLMRGFSPIMPG